MTDEQIKQAAEEFALSKIKDKNRQPDNDIYFAARTAYEAGANFGREIGMKEAFECGCEVWKDAIGYEGLYQVSSNGRLRSLLRRPGIVKPCLGKNGYVHNCLTDKKNKRKTVDRHRLIAESFYGDRCIGLEVNHKNGDKTDNRLINLELCTKSQNQRHAIDVLGKKPTRYWAGRKGKEHTASKPVAQIDSDGSIVQKFYSIKDASDNFKINRCSISLCCRGELKKAGGKMFKFLNQEDML